MGFQGLIGYGGGATGLSQGSVEAFTASGGDTTEAQNRSGWTVHNFFPTTPAPEKVFTVTGAGSVDFEILVVGGGGGGGFGGGGSQGGGAGAGGVVHHTFSGLDSGTYPITIGSGGEGRSTDGVGNAGGDTAFGTAPNPYYLVGKGGGGGGGANTEAPDTGGSGGGGERDSSSPYAGTAAQPTQPGNSGTYGHGYPGSYCIEPDSNGGAGGGGGAGGPGQGGIEDYPGQYPTSGRSGGSGGYGYECTITGIRGTYAGGGGGCAWNNQAGIGGRGAGPGSWDNDLVGGGGRGVSGTVGQNPLPVNATGYGSGGGGGYDGSGNSGDGAGGLVQIAYKTDPSSAYDPVSISGGDANYTVGSKTVRVYTGPGQITLPSGTTEIDYFIIAGGGAGGADGGGGGGGGGCKMGKAVISGPNTFAVTVGPGATAEPRNNNFDPDENGAPSSIAFGGPGPKSPLGTITATGGGAGGRDRSPGPAKGQNGGCGGGGFGNTGSDVQGGESPDPIQGSPGFHNHDGGNSVGGGGGGAGDGNHKWDYLREADGGAGVRLPAIFLSPTNVYGGKAAPYQATLGSDSDAFYFGGGGGGSGDPGSNQSKGAAYAGGRDGASSGNGNSGYANTGGGGGGGNSSGAGNGGNGGSGIVFIAYPT